MMSAAVRPASGLLLVLVGVLWVAFAGLVGAGWASLLPACAITWPVPRLAADQCPRPLDPGPLSRARARMAALKAEIGTAQVRLAELAPCPPGNPPPPGGTRPPGPRGGGTR